MKSLIASVLIILIASTSTGLKSQTDYNHDSVTPYIEVTGVAEKEVIPDEIYIAVRIKERYDGRDKVTVEQQEKALKQGMADIRVPAGNIFMSDANAEYVRVKWSKKNVIAESEYIIKVWDAAMVSKVFEKLDELKLEESKISRVNHSDIENIRKEVKIMAIKAAKEKADYLLAAIGHKTGKPMMVTEVSPFSIPYASNVRNEYAPEGALYYELSERDKMGEDVLQFRKIKVDSQIMVRFGIE